MEKKPAPPRNLQQTAEDYRKKCISSLERRSGIAAIRLSIYNGSRLICSWKSQVEGKPHTLRINTSINVQLGSGGASSFSCGRNLGTFNAETPQDFALILERIDEFILNFAIKHRIMLDTPPLEEGINRDAGERLQDAREAALAAWFRRGYECRAAAPKLTSLQSRWLNAQLRNSSSLTREQYALAREIDEIRTNEAERIRVEKLNSRRKKAFKPTPRAKGELFNIAMEAKRDLFQLLEFAQLVGGLDVLSHDSPMLEIRKYAEMRDRLEALCESGPLAKWAMDYFDEMGFPPKTKEKK